MLAPIAAWFKLHNTVYMMIMMKVKHRLNFEPTECTPYLTYYEYLWVLWEEHYHNTVLL